MALPSDENKQKENTSEIPTFKASKSAGAGLEWRVFIKYEKAPNLNIMKLLGLYSIHSTAINK